MIKVIRGKREWGNLLAVLGKYDFYHTYDYHKLSCKHKERAILISYTQGDVAIAMPLVIRPIPGSDYFDATSVYGYAGPLGKNVMEGFDFSTFYTSLSNFLKEERIVSVFSSLNPYIPHQERILGNLGDIVDLGNIVNVDLTEEVHAQRNNFSRTTKRYLNRSKRLCYTRVGNSSADVLKFIELYYDNMRRVNATDYYFFPKSYFYDLIRGSGYKTEIIFAELKETGEIISAAIMIKTNKRIIQYHLSGTAKCYLHLSPLRLLIDETRTKGTKEGYKFFNLGGGLGSREDSLFHFKSSISKDIKKFKVWKYIVDKTVYDQLSEKNPKLAQKEKTDFFPQYRY